MFDNKMATLYRLRWMVLAQGDACCQPSEKPPLIFPSSPRRCSDGINGIVCNNAESRCREKAQEEERHLGSYCEASTEDENGFGNKCVCVCV